MTTIDYELVSAGTVKLEVFNVRGQLVRTLVDGVAMPPGRQTVTWDGRDNGGKPAASGVYMVRLRAGGKEHYRKATLLQ
jgi:flagellar hook assembly protein FlgD